MQLKVIQPALFVFFSFLLVPLAIAEGPPQPSPPTTWPPPTPTVPPVPEPTVAPVYPPSGVTADEVVPVVITYGEGLETQATIAQGLMLPVGVPREKSVTVSLFLPSTYAGQTVALRLYDGGQVGPAAPPGTPIAPSGTRTGGIEALTFILNVARDGTVHFNFEAGALLGLYRLAAAIGPNRYLLQFHAVRPRATAGPAPIPDPAASPTPLPNPNPIVTPQPPPIG